MFTALFSWFALMVLETRPMCAPSLDGEPCPWMPW